jgi:hypothetical protein
MLENINFILDEAVKVKLVQSKELEPRVYPVTFPGRVNGRVREI